MPDWKTTVNAIRADRARLRAHLAAEHPPRRTLVPAGLITAVLHRLAHYCYVRGWRLSARLIWLSNLVLTGADIDCAATIGKGLVLPYPRTTIIYGTLGENCTCMAWAGVGGILRHALADIGAGKGKPILDDEVVLGPGALVLGPITIGRGVRIGPYCCVTRSLPDGAQMNPPAWPGTPRQDIAPMRRGATTRWHATRQALAADRARLCAYYAEMGEQPGFLWLRSAYLVVVLHRVAAYLQGIGLHLAARLVSAMNMVLTGADIDPAAEVGAGVLIPVPGNVTCHGRIGENCTLGAQVSIGWQAVPTRLDRGGGAGRPCVEDDVNLGPGTVILGPVRVGAGVRTGPRSLIIDDIPAGEYVAPQRWRVMRA
jgi:serine acetyltransferase